jgi:hypothetical protein
MGGNRTATRIRPLLVVGAGACALAAIVTSSLDRNAYFYYRHMSRPPWEYPTALVLFVVLATVAETGVAYALFARTRVQPLWKPAALALLALVPWGMVLSEWVIHSPGFWLLHLSWLWLLIAVIAVAATISGAANGYRALRSRGGAA